MVGVVASLVVGGGAGVAAPGAQPVPSASLGASAPDIDMEARDLFRAQRYAEALAIYQRRHAETHHPTYLRNIGRCYQMSRQPAPAIDAFRGYLREARDLEAAERTEIEGYIAEMQRLELSAAPASPAAPPALAAPASLTSPTALAAPAWPASPASRAGAPDGTLSLAVSPPATATAAPTPPGSDSPPLTRRWWFWTAIAVGLAAATTGVLLAATRGPDRLPCPSGAVCP